MVKLKDYMKERLFLPGHRGCSGCGQMIAARHVIVAAGRDSIIVNSTGCLEVVSTPYPQSAWQVPYIHSLFENSAAVASGIFAAQKFLQNQKSSLGNTRDKQIKNQKLGAISSQNDYSDMPNVIVMAGDGGTIDIGFGLLSGMFERGDNVLYVCFDNEGYQNTGAQASGSTLYGSETMTTPIGKLAFGAVQPKKNMPAFAVSQGVHYVATASIGYPDDIVAKVKKALEFTGPKYIQIFVPCPVGWSHDSDLTIEIAKQVVLTGLYPVIEVVQGQITKVLKVPEPRPKVEEFLKNQGRFRHLFRDERGKEVIDHLQKMADENISTFGLCKACETHSVLTHYESVDNLDTQ